ncbi:MAG: glycerate kinase, partial [Clostridiales bacterium]|nr:glycerate kinase [Clostridiales bacterium]
ADGDTRDQLRAEGLDIFKILENNNAYPALQKVGGLIMTGATGTNVNDVSVLLIKR